SLSRSCGTHVTISPLAWAVGLSLLVRSALKSSHSRTFLGERNLSLLKAQERCKRPSSTRAFFSSRRRHTISKRDWSSDVCSSDLPKNPDVVYCPSVRLLKSIDGGKSFKQMKGVHHPDHHDLWIDPKKPRRMIDSNDGGVDKIGRASCRERGKNTVAKELWCMTAGE